MNCAIAVALGLAAFPAMGHVGPATQQQTDAATPELTLQAYRQAVENLDVATMQQYFTEDSQIFESGTAEGSFANYLEHHLKPELAEFQSFEFSDVKAKSKIVGDVAVASETYRYTIVLKEGREITRQGVATSMLVRMDGVWKIRQYHSSSRMPSS